jgi:ferritin
MQELNNSPQSTLSQETEQLLNQQVAIEAKASAAYLAMASWCDVKGYKQSADLLYKQSTEERDHMLKLVHYINDIGGHALQPEIVAIQNSFQSLREVFEIAFSQELRVTQAIHHLVEHCWNQKDLKTYYFLQWYVAEQTEEELRVRRILQLFDSIGEVGIGLYMIDKEIGELGK